MIEDQAALRITRMTAADIDAVVELQLEALPDSLVTQLGDRFLRRFHESALCDAATVGVVARAEPSGLAGFILGTTDGPGFRRRVRSQTLPALLRALAFRPAFVPVFAQSVLHREPSSPIAVELLLLAVKGDYRRRHIASDLVRVLEDHLRARGATEYRVAVRSWLTAALEFYRSMGFEVECEAEVLGAAMTYLRRRFADGSS